ncbi:MAG: cell division protein [Brevundimonas sp.]|uniref:cell division protein FtsL n=1 Tax=Brevundimonas sp. TaxID=1871086 RepID=UPI003919BF4F
MSAARSFFDWKVRGFRVVEIIGLAVLAVIIMSVYFAKAQAARQSAEIDGLHQAISNERQRVRLLTAEAARLEEPGRLEALSRHAGLEPVSVEQRADLDGLDALMGDEHAPELAAEAAQ